MAEINYTVWMESGIGKELTEHEARELHLVSRREKYESGQHLFDEGDPANELFLIVEGEVQILKRSDDKEAVIATLGPGSIVGEMSLLTGTKRGASAAATGATTVLRVSWDDFQELLKHNPNVAFKLIYALASVLAMRLKRINLKVAELTTTDATDAGKGSKLEEFATFKRKLMSEWSF